MNETFMTGYIGNIEQATIANETYRSVLYTDNNVQLVVMSILPGDEIGEEVHQLDQFIRVESGEGKAILNGVESGLIDGVAVIVPQGTRHNIVNTSIDRPLKLYTIYAPPNHKPGTVHKTKADALADEHEHFDPKDL